MEQLNSVLALGDGNLYKPISKVQMPTAVVGEGEGDGDAEVLDWSAHDRRLQSDLTVRCALPWPPNKLFLQVSQSGCANLINGHTSLQSPTGK